MQKYIPDIIKNISDIIKFDSSQQPSKEGMPFGEGVAKCLDYFLSLAEFLGFETKNYDNYVGEVVWGRGEEFAILCHLDVVPAGSGWTKAPFGGEVDQKNGRIWGRGAMDDKGPAIISLYAMKALKDKGFKPNKKIKLIVGCNEESGWGCIEHYKKVAKMPKIGFSPDADFPVIYAEKGIIHLRFAFKTQGDFSVRGGGAANMVCDYCEAEAPVSANRLTELNLFYEEGKIVSRGKSAHGSTPEKGINAIAPMLKYLGLENIYELLFVYKCGLNGLCDETGELTFSPNVIETVGDMLYITCDMRYPATFKRDEIISKLNQAQVSYQILHEQAPLFNDKNCNLIKTLCSVYSEVTGKNAQPIAIGGGTYARALECGAGFGPEEEGEENVIHQPDEYITFEKIERCFKTYTLAIERLT